jgi:hypothetical protein
MEEMLMNIFLLLSVPLGLFMFYHGVQGLRKRQITRNQNTYTGCKAIFIAVMYVLIGLCGSIIAISMLISR